MPGAGCRTTAEDPDLLIWKDIMGITIHYKLSTEKPWSSESVREWLKLVAGHARHLGCESVGEIQSATMCPDLTELRFKKATRLQKKSACAEAGWLVTIYIGDGCGPLTLGLCKYPIWRTAWKGRRWREVPSGLPEGWVFGWYCKTQFAGQHGPAHFIRCHKTVVSLLDFCRKAGVNVSVQDEAGYWERRDEHELLTMVRRNEVMLAALGGVLKDMTGKRRDRKIKSVIFAYPNFEQLEHEGWQLYRQLFASLQNSHD
jgi:hypothetical protein